ESRNHFDPANIDSRRAQRDGLEVISVHQTVAMLQVTRDLFLAFGDGFAFGPVPGAHRIADLDARGQCRTRTNRSGPDVAGGTNAVVVTGAHPRVRRWTFTAKPVAEFDLAGFRIDHVNFAGKIGGRLGPGRKFRIDYLD